MIICNFVVVINAQLLITLFIYDIYHSAIPNVNLFLYSDIIASIVLKGSLLLLFCAVNI